MTDSFKAVDEQIVDVINLVKQNHPNADTSMIEKAYELAKNAHGDQKRRSGEPYIIHPVAVAYILAEYHMDVETIVAALLHDVIEDTEYTYEDLTREFNEQIAYMVESVSKMTRLNYQSKEESQAEYIRKMILSMSNDIRIILIKLVDRLHNMRTLEYMSSKKQIEKSKETLDIYAPIANRLGIQSIKSELEDLSFKYLDPYTYYDLLKKVRLKTRERELYIQKVVGLIKKELKDADINAKVYGRTKHIYSIYKKMTKSGRDFDEIYDLYAVRVIVDTIEECYAALGVIHMKWNAIPNRMKDYITMPKANGYQSFHTTVIGPNGQPLEIQIRTKEMHEKDEYGVAAHWKYKEGKVSLKEKDQKYDEGISWLRQVIDWSNDSENTSDFVETIKTDIFPEEVYVYTPSGEVIDLPAGSTPIDFAYRIHTDVGNHCIGAKVNDKIVPLNFKLRLGDIVNIMTSKQSKGPSREWIRFAKTKHAKNKIRQYFKHIERDENISRGRKVLEGEVKKLGHISEELLKHQNLSLVAKSMEFESLEDLYLSLGVASTGTGSVIHKMEFLFPDLFPKEQEEEIELSEIPKFRESNILVAGQDGIETHFAKCCNPLPGDKIIGYTTALKGISVHRTDCKNITNLKDPERLIQVEWSRARKPTRYASEVFIESYSKPGGLLDILKPFYDLNIPITSTVTKTEGSLDLFNITCEVKNASELNKLLTELKKLDLVIRVNRV